MLFLRNINHFIHLSHCLCHPLHLPVPCPPPPSCFYLTTSCSWTPEPIIPSSPFHDPAFCSTLQFRRWERLNMSLSGREKCMESIRGHLMFVHLLLFLCVCACSCMCSSCNHIWWCVPLSPNNFSCRQSTCLCNNFSLCAVSLSAGFTMAITAVEQLPL